MRPAVRVLEEPEDARDDVPRMPGREAGEVLLRE
jgi:hypothetical protein